MKLKITIITLLMICTQSVFSQARTITGTVKDKFDTPLPGVTIVIEGTTNGTTSDFDGNYTLEGVSNSDKLTFSFIGMNPQTIPAGNQTTINITLEESSESLDEIVVVGYGTVRKVDITGAVGTVQSDELVKISTTSTAQTLQGRMAGVQVTQSSGEPGAGSVIKIRGIGSLKSNNSPLVLVDGFPGSIDGVEPNDIESISVLKDASAAAIYGSRAANGVILITTKRGKLGSFKVDVTVEGGVSSLTKQPKFLESSDFATKANEASIWAGSEPTWTGEYAPENLTGGTQWFDEVYSQGSYTKIYANMTGGSEKTKYAVSLGNTHQEGVIKNTDFNRMTARANFDHEFNDKFNVGVNISLNRENKFRGNENIWGDGIGYNGYGLAIAAIRSSPTIPAYFDDGTKGIYRAGVPQEQPGNGTLPPTWYFGNKDMNDVAINNRVSLFADWEIIEGLTSRTIINTKQGSGYKTHWNGTWEAYSPGETTPAQINSVNGLDTGSSNYYGWEFQQLLTYEKTFNKHGVYALAGFSSEENNNEYVYLNKQNFPGNSLRVADGGTIVSGQGGSKYTNSFTSWFGRVKYNYDGKYLIQATVRRDGSSVFAPGNQYATFPSISGAWRIGKEAFMDNQNLFSELKIRGGYGQLGNAGIPSFKWVGTYKITDAHPFNDSFQPAYYITEMTNENVKWETTTTIDIGLDFSILNGRLKTQFDYYKKNTTDLLWPATIPQSAGDIAGPMVNIGEVENKGWELTFNWDDSFGEFKYGLSANMSKNDNTIIDMGGIPDQLSGNSIVKEGLPVNSYWGYKTEGLWETWAELDANTHRSGDIRPGDYRFSDINNDGEINSEDKVYLGDTSPDFYYGFSGYAEYKNFDLSFLFNGESGKQTMIEQVYGGGYRVGENSIQWYFDNRAILDSNGEVVGGGQVHATGANSAGGNDSNASDVDIHDLSYLRVKNIQLGYNLDKQLLEKIKINSARIYLNATNPFLFTDYVGWDQETSAITSGQVNRGGNQYVPVSKTFSIGLNVKF